LGEERPIFSNEIIRKLAEAAIAVDNSWVMRNQPSRWLAGKWAGQRTELALRGYWNRKFLLEQSAFILGVVPTSGQRRLFPFPELPVRGTRARRLSVRGTRLWFPQYRPSWLVIWNDSGLPGSGWSAVLRVSGMWLFSVSGLAQDVCEHGDACADGVMGSVAEAEDELRWLRGVAGPVGAHSVGTGRPLLHRLPDARR
jgi:hypothetical protein